ncbi:MAG: NADPH-dependent glutamate synthase [Armatimonadetes bacterium]|nr:NADPH-dependent glutamate synthase [Armatimonadota bacterium]
MYEILERRQLVPDTHVLTVHAPHVARKVEAGQFIILRPDEDGERIPLSVADWDREAGTVTNVFLEAGATTMQLARLNAGDTLPTYMGPLGTPSEIGPVGTVICCGGCYGLGAVYPIARAHKAVGNRVISILEAHTEWLLYWVEKHRQLVDEVYTVTSDGTSGRKGLSFDVVRELVEGGLKVDLVHAVGCTYMMQASTLVAVEQELDIRVALNPVMVDGTGMCGGCRCSVDGQQKFACVDGPEFDGKQVDWERLQARRKSYRAHELAALRRFESRAGETKGGGIDLHRREMPTQEADERVRNFDEVALGYTIALAEEEARRCLDCKRPRCIEGCPVAVNIPDFIRALRDGDAQLAIDALRSTNLLPAVCGRVCPQESQCEAMCNLSKRGASVAIGRLERFVADWAAAHDLLKPPAPAPPTGKRIAVVGSGPSGLTCACDLLRLGHAVTIYEALHEPGGVLTYGIPEFRLPKDIVRREIDQIRQMGADIVCDFVVGRSATIHDLQDEFDAVYVATGAGLPWFLEVPGEDLVGVMSANEYLTRVNLLRAYVRGAPTPVPKGHRVAVVGAGNVAMDACRTAKRLGAKDVHIVYRRSRAEAPARAEELEHAEEEGIVFDFLTLPTEFIGNADGCVEAMRCIRMELGEPDERGRRSPVPIPDSEFVTPVDLVILAIGQSPNPLIASTTPELAVSRRGTIVADEASGRTNLPGVFAGGDVVTGQATVIKAMGAGRAAAASIDAWLREGVWELAPDAASLSPPS